MNDARNTNGQAYALTVLTPILDGHESRLARYLNALGTGPDSPLARVPGTHFARWVLIGDVVYEGDGQRRDHLAVGRLLFSSNFDGSPDPYIEALRIGLAGHADEIWGNCTGYPGSEDGAAFAAYLRAYQVESSLFFAAYGEQTVGEVKRNLAARRDLIKFALDAQGQSAVELKAAFRKALPG